MTVSTVHTNTDAEIILRVLKGDPRAYALLVDRHKEKGMALAFRMLRTREEAEEALQDAFVRAFKALQKFEMKSSFSTWFYRIVYNVCATRLTRRGERHKNEVEVDEQIADRTRSEEPLPDMVLESAQTEVIIQEEVDKLPEVFGTVFTLFAVNDKTYDEIMEITGAPLGTVKARLFRARSMLRDAVAKRLRMENAQKSKKKEEAA
jgi:RNA polymerase sigma-70 factor (ECF subfamily)